MIFCKELNTEFTNKETMFKALKANEQQIISLKKSAFYEGRDKKANKMMILDPSKIPTTVKADFVEEGYIYPVISTTRWFDSHKDVHFDGCFNKTVPEQQGKVYYVLDHKLEFGSIVAWPKNVEMLIMPLDWNLVGKNIDGQTEALVFKIHRDKVRPDVLQAIENKVADFENSIRMIYDKIRLGVNSFDKELAENKAYYDSRINLIANKEEVGEDQYFWGIEELKIYKEGSLVVAGGSNSATGIIQYLGADEIVTLETKELNPSADSSAAIKRSIINQLM